MTAEITKAREAMAVAIATSVEIRAFVATNLDGATLAVVRDHFPGDARDNLCPFVGLGPHVVAEPEGDRHTLEYSLPMGIYLKKAGSESEKGADNVFRSPEAAILAELSEMVEKVASAALMAAGFAYDQDPYQPEDVQWGRFFMEFFLYRIKTRRIVA